MAKKKTTAGKKGASDEGRKFAIEAARIAQDANATEIVVLDLRGISPVADYFVIATGTSNRQMASIADDIEEYGRSVGQKVWQEAGRDSGQWIVLDYVDVVVHLFDTSHRRYYDLELIWGESPRVRWQRRATPKKSASETEHIEEEE